MSELLTPSFPLKTMKMNPLEAFQIIEKISEGDSTVTYKALSRITDKLVSIKVFSLPTSFFQGEDVELIKTIEHPFIEKLIDVYVENQQMWFVRDYNQLGSIADIMKMTQNPLNEPEISCICYSTLYALDYIHTLNRVHKGVKLNNIIVNSSGQIKLTDFGTSIKSFSLSNPKSRGLDFSVDITNLGICLIQMAGILVDMPNNNATIPLSSVKKLINQLDASIYSAKFKDFVTQCFLNEKHNAINLLNHLFLLSYKQDFAFILKKFHAENSKLLLEYRKGLILQNQNEPGKFIKPCLENFTGEENVVDESEIPTSRQNETSNQFLKGNTIDYSLESDNFLSFIDKSDFHFTEPKSNMSFNNQSSILPCKTQNFDGQDSFMNTQPFQYMDTYKRSILAELEYQESMFPSQNPNLEHQLNKGKKIAVPALKFNKAVTATTKPSIFERKAPPKTIFTKNIENDRELMNLPFKKRASTPGVVKRERTGNVKNYKATNESNFRVKHQVSNTRIQSIPDESLTSESVLMPFSASRQHLRAESENFDLTRQLIYDAKKLNPRTPELLKTMDTMQGTGTGLGLTALTSELGSLGNFKSFLSTSKSNCSRNTLLKVVQQNLEYTSREKSLERSHINSEFERTQLGSQLQKSLEFLKRTTYNPGTKLL